MGQKRNMPEGWVTDTFGVCVQGIPHEVSIRAPLRSAEGDYILG